MRGFTTRSNYELWDSLQPEVVVTMGVLTTRSNFMNPGIPYNPKYL